jgi:hypothetical protein
MEIPNNKYLINECAVCWERFNVFVDDDSNSYTDIVAEFGCNHVFCLDCAGKLLHRKEWGEVKCPTCVRPVLGYKVGEYSVVLDVTGPETVDLTEAACGDEVDDNGVLVVDLTLPDHRVTYEG